MHWKATRLSELGHDVMVVTAFSRANRAIPKTLYRVREENIAPRGDLLSIQRGVLALLRNYAHCADIFHVDGQLFLYGAGWYRLTGGTVPVAAFFNMRLRERHTPLSLWGALRMALERVIGARIANYIDGFIFNTPHLRAHYERFGIYPRHCTIIEDFVDTEALMHAYPPSREQEPTKIHLLASGRILPEKGFAILLRAFASLQHKERYELTISGSGPDEGRIKEVARELGLLTSVHFPGWVPRETLLEFFRTADIFVFPRWWIECGSAVLSEAFAFGLPTIVPKGGALEWLSRRASLSFTDGDATALRDAIEKLGTDHRMRRTLSEKALETARGLAYQKLGDRLAGFLNEISAARG